jgi:hypothetical protein
MDPTVYGKFRSFFLVDIFVGKLNCSVGVQSGVLFGEHGYDVMHSP